MVDAVGAEPQPTRGDFRYRIPSRWMTKQSTQEQDRQLDELTGELRVIIPGVTVLFAFLLTVPFSAGLDGLDAVDRAAYFMAFLGTALAIVLLLGESAYPACAVTPMTRG